MSEGSTERLEAVENRFRTLVNELPDGSVSVRVNEARRREGHVIFYIEPVAMPTASVHLHLDKNSGAVDLVLADDFAFEFDGDCSESVAKLFELLEAARDGKITAHCVRRGKTIVSASVAFMVNDKEERIHCQGDFGNPFRRKVVEKREFRGWLS